MAAPEAQADPEARTVADRLRGARRRRFVGRAAELELFETALETSPFAVLFIHGPGGVGKTALLRRARARPPQARRRARHVRRPALDRAVAARVRRGGRRGRACCCSTPTRRRRRSTDWLRERFLPALPAEAMVVIAGRDPPGPAWREDPGWRDLLRTRVAAQPRPRGRARLPARGGRARGLHERGAGRHPRPPAGAPPAGRRARPALRRPVELGAAPDVVRELLAASSPTPRAPGTGRRSTSARMPAYTTEDLLAEALGGDDAAELFEWLRGLLVRRAGPDGAFPHDIARDVLEADLRWRDPAGYVDQHRRIRRHVIARLRATSGAEQQRGVADLIFLHRGNPVDAGAVGLGQLRARLRRGGAPEDRAGDPRHGRAPRGRRVARTSRVLARPPAGGFWVFRGARRRAVRLHRGARAPSRERAGHRRAIPAAARHVALRPAPRPAAAGRGGAVRALLHGPRRLPGARRRPSTS